jgi:hypothetical protein
MCKSCENISALLIGSDIPNYAREIKSKVLCKNNHVVFDGTV